MKQPDLNITIIGGGHLATHLAARLQRKANVNMVLRDTARSQPFFESGVNVVSGAPDNSDIIIVCVSDRSIADVAAKLDATSALVVHCSGSQPLKVLKQKRAAVMYPLQTFSAGVKVDWKSIPIFLTAKNDESRERVQQLARILSKKIHWVSDRERARLHLAATIANNFTNALIAEAFSIAGEYAKDLLPLIHQTVNKLDKLTPIAAQTGPAKRGDKITMDAHLKLLNDQQLKDIYSSMSDLIRRQQGTIKKKKST